MYYIKFRLKVVNTFMGKMNLPYFMELVGKQYWANILKAAADH